MTLSGNVSARVAACPFCHPEMLNQVRENQTVYAVKDTTPVTPGHLLIIPKRHCKDYFDMTRAEKRDAQRLIESLKQTLLETDPTVKGFNIGVNCGEIAGQTIFHAHIHFIPRRKNDTPNPRGGVRGVIPNRMNY